VVAALALRLLDHVRQVRAAALAALRPQMSGDVVERVLESLVRGEDRHYAPRTMRAAVPPKFPPASLPGPSRLRRHGRTRPVARDRERPLGSA